MGAAFVEGVQSQGVGASLKHYLANNQEHRRMDSSSEMDERTMREIYMPAFERVVKKAKPWTIMASYNKIAGTHTAPGMPASEDSHRLCSGLPQKAVLPVPLLRFLRLYEKPTKRC